MLLIFNFIAHNKKIENRLISNVKKNFLIKNIKMELSQYLYKPTNQYIKDVLNVDLSNHPNNEVSNVNIVGWVKTIRKQSEMAFIKINDGSTINSLQCIFNGESEHLDDISTGSSLEVVGKLVKPPETSKEKIECIITEFRHVGKIVDKDYILAGKGRVKNEVMRQHLHIRPKANLFSSIFRIRSALSQSVHEFFQGSGFYHLNPNVITTSDCEGAGETFKIEGSEDFFRKPAYLTVSSQLQLEALSSGLRNCYTTNPSMRAEKSHTTRHLACFEHVEYEMSFCDLNDLMNLSESFVKFCIKAVLDRCRDDLETINRYFTKGIITKLEHYVKTDFPRISYTEAIDIINQELKTGRLKFKRDKKSEKLLSKTNKQIKILQEQLDSLNETNEEASSLREQLDKATEIAQSTKDRLDNMDKPPVWGEDLGSICEKHLAENVYKSPIMVYNYPKDLKSFYMKQNDDEPRTVQAMDLLVPNIGELIGSSVREDDYDVLMANIRYKGINPKPLEWYADLRKNGTWRHAGAGVGFERLVGMMTMDSNNFNIRDCVPFPVAYKECTY